MFKITRRIRKEIAIWDYFTYDSVVNKSKCLLRNKILSDKNSTNIKAHLNIYHK